MFASLIGWLSSALTWVKEQLGLSVKWWTDWLNPIWAVIIIVAGWVYATVVGMVDAISAAVTSFDGWALPTLDPSMPGTLSYAASVANTFFPLSETVAFTLAYFTLIVALTTYRFIKSWIPTLS